MAVVVPTGLGAEVSELIDKLRAATGRAVLIVGSGSSLDPTQEIVDASDEAALLARVDRSLAPAAKTEEAAPLLHFANYSLDLLGYSLVDEAGQEVCLTRGEFRRLREFVHRPGRVLSRDQLLQASAGRDAETYDRSIDMLIMRLRRKIEFDPKRPRLIVTVPGSGYKFTTQVRSVWSAGPPGSPLRENLRGAEILPDLYIRVGIATGVVVADPGGEVTGDAPSDAGRMRSLAEPGQVVLPATTQQLGGRLFTYHAVEPMAPTGVLGPTTAWRVLGRNTSVSRSEALYDGTLAPLVRRAEERNSTTTCLAAGQIRRRSGCAALR